MNKMSNDKNAGVSLGALLRGKEGAVLYSTAHGPVELSSVRMYVSETTGIRVKPLTQGVWPEGFEVEFGDGGCFYTGGECCLFPSREERDWMTWLTGERVPETETYWYVDDMFEPLENTEDMTDIDEGYWRAGNYFRTEEEAAAVAGAMRAALMRYRMDMMCGKEAGE